MAPFDLLTTADADFVERLSQWPGFRTWRRFLRLRTTFIGTTVTEYAPVPDTGGADAQAAATLAASLRERLGRGAALTILKDLPQDSPLLSAQDNAFADELARACEARDFIPLTGQALAYVPIDPGDRPLDRIGDGRLGFVDDFDILRGDEVAHDQASSCRRRSPAGSPLNREARRLCGSSRSWMIANCSAVGTAVSGMASGRSRAKPVLS